MNFKIVTGEYCSAETPTDHWPTSVKRVCIDPSARNLPPPPSESALISRELDARIIRDGVILIDPNKKAHHIRDLRTFCNVNLLDYYSFRSRLKRGITKTYNHKTNSGWSIHHGQP